MKNRIRLTESALRKIVKESVKKALNELGQPGDRFYFPSPQIEYWEEMRYSRGYVININNGEIVKEDDAPEEPGLGSNWAYLSFYLKCKGCIGGDDMYPDWPDYDIMDWNAEVDSGDEKIDSMVEQKFKKNIEAFFDDNYYEIESYSECIERLEPDEPDYERDDDF